MAREITAEERRQLGVESQADSQLVPQQGRENALDVEKKPKARPLSPDEIKSLNLGQEEPKQPGEPATDPGVIKRLVSRFMGSDVDDPLEFERLGTIAAFGAGGAKVGATAGSALGPAGTAAGGVAGGVAGATAGAVAPEATLNVMELFGIEGARNESLSDEELKRVAEGEALLELATAGTAGGVRLAGRTAGRALTGVTKEGEKVAEDASKLGVELTPLQVGTRDLGKTVVNVMGRFPFIGTAAKRSAQTTDEQVKRILDEMPERVGPLLSGSGLGFRIFDDANNLVKEVSKNFGEQYDDLFLRASKSGVEVVPRQTGEVIDGVLDNIKKNTPTSAGAITTPAKASNIAKRFIENNLSELDNMSLGQADELLSKVDQAIASAPSSIKKQVAQKLNPVKGAIKADILNNMTGEGSEQIGKELAELDGEFSNTMSTLFETATAKKFQSVKRQGLRGVDASSENATRVAVDKLSKIVTDLDSPQSIEELRRLVPKETFNQVAARSLSDAYSSALRETANGATELRPDKLERVFGLSGKSTSRKEAWAELLKDSGYSQKNIETLVETTKKIHDAPVPNISTFIARRATIGGVKSVVNGAIPFLAFTSGGAASGGGLGALLGGLTFLGGSRMLVNVMSNPTSARALKNVIEDETNLVQSRQSFVRMARVGINGMEEAGNITAEQAKELSTAASEYANSAFGDAGKDRTNN